jgi:hypothetical protein
LSFKALAWAFDQELKTPEKSVLIALAYRDNHDEPHGCFPSLARVAKDCGLDRSTVVRCIKSLIFKGLVARKSRRDPKGDKATSFYTLPPVWVGAHSTYGRCCLHLGVGAHSTIEPKELTVREPKPRSHKPRTSPIPLEEKIRRVSKRDERLAIEAEVRMEVNVGAGPELVRKRPPDMSVQELAKCIGGIVADRKAM